MKKRLLNLAAMMLVGDGVLTTLRPRREARLWKAGPQFHQRLMEGFAEHRQLARAAALCELGVGFWLAARNV